MVTFIADNPNLSVTTPRARVRGRGLCQGVSAGARAQKSIETGLLSDFRHFVNSGASFTGP
jgi:hypothetical protein